MRIVALLLCFNHIFAGQTTQAIQGLHKQIGEKLIKIRKESPRYQAEIYEILDHVGKLTRLSNIALEKKKEMKRASRQEREMRFALKVENEKLKSSISELTQEIKVEHLRLAENEKQLNVLSKEKQKLMQKNQEYSSREQEYEAKMKVLAKSFTKAENDTPEKHNKNKQTTT